MNWRVLTNSYTAIPLMLLAVLAMMILPLPGWLLDALFTFNIVLAVLVLLVSVSARRPLDFSIFPTVLLVATLMRLSLNVASTRVVLLNGHEGHDAAGKVIQAFGEVVIGGNYVVGLVVFIILMIINFVVITKGGERISEVSARFTLDALPGKQMAIDADLNAGIMDQHQAKARREEIAREADFYGAMDGASKFVRGDAIAGLLVLIINLVGGLAIGIFQHAMPVAEAFQRYALLTIGDGLVAQIPSLLMSTAAAIIVTRVNDEGEMTDQVGQQLLASPRVIYTAAAVMTILGLIPGMPAMAFLSFAAVLAWSGWRVSKRQPEAPELEAAEQIAKQMDLREPQGLEWQDLPALDNVVIELGYRLVSLAEQDKGAELLSRVRGIRKTLSEQFGFLLPEIRVRDNLQLQPEQYSIKLAGVALAAGQVDCQRLMAIGSSETYGALDGELTQDPAFGMEAVWILPDSKAKALNLGYSVVDSATVIATHLSKLLREHLDELFGHDEVGKLGQHLAAQSPRLNEELNLALTQMQQLRVYRQLLREQVSLVDIRTIATTLLDSSEITKDPVLLASDVRCALKRQLVRQAIGQRDVLATFTLDDRLEQTLLAALSQSQQQGKVSLDSFPIDPQLLAQLQQNMPLVKTQLQQLGHPPVLVVMPQLRPLLSRYARSFSRGLKVLSYNEIPEELRVDVIGTLG
ncbi:lateral flagellar biosynthesis protein LfhA [Aeromonas diversa]|uniref:Flagellar biosynthesis protein FlhA n=1 Tax=Aeromonas diversa CDC 2478-85 TaxID=1268237 RepID=N9TZD1_9GAMM|nr:lateral flagellar biosynthesis protein LfhA [Aeromonas diversa]ENY71425.1 lateral flagellar biosynthesis protein [Aeromonas diversa CDC 2478-85]